MSDERIRFPRIFAVNVDALETVRKDENHIWGAEDWILNDAKHGVCTKFLTIFPGFQSSKHNHETKWEYFIVLSGKLELDIWDDPDVFRQYRTLSTGQRHFIPAGQYHRFRTNTREFVLLLEVSGFENELTNKAEPSRQLY